MNDKTTRARPDSSFRYMCFLWLEVADEPLEDRERTYPGGNSIALLSNWNKKEKADGPSVSWIARYCPIKKVRIQACGIPTMLAAIMTRFF